MSPMMPPPASVMPESAEGVHNSITESPRGSRPSSPSVNYSPTRQAPQVIIEERKSNEILPPVEITPAEQSTAPPGEKSEGNSTLPNTSGKNSEDDGQVDVLKSLENIERLTKFLMDSNAECGNEVVVGLASEIERNRKSVEIYWKDLRTQCNQDAVKLQKEAAAQKRITELQNKRIEELENLVADQQQVSTPSPRSQEAMFEEIMKRLDRLESGGKVSPSNQPAKQIRTYSDAAQQKTLLIRPTGKNTVANVAKTITSIKTKLVSGITKVTPTNTALIIETNTPAEATAARKVIEELKDDGFQVVSRGQVQKKMILFNVPKEERPESADFKTKLMDALNLQHTESVTVVRKFDSKTRKTAEHVIFRVPASTAADLAEAGSLYMGFTRFHVSRYVEVQQCRTCFSYEHSAARCQNGVWCGFCARKHPTTTCAKKQDDAWCLHCSNDADFKHDSAHPSFAKRCPFYREALKKSLKN